MSKEKSVCSGQTLVVFLSTFNPWLVESVDVEPRCLSLLCITVINTQNSLGAKRVN